MWKISQDKALKTTFLSNKLSIHSKFYRDFALKIWKYAVIIHFKNRSMSYLDKSNLLIKFLLIVLPNVIIYNEEGFEDIEGKCWTHPSYFSWKHF